MQLNTHFAINNPYKSASPHRPASEPPTAAPDSTN